MMTQSRTRRPRLREALDPGLFKALGDATRVELLSALGERAAPTTVTGATACCSVDVSVVSRHLATLREAGVVRSERHGREVRYTVSHRDLAGRLRAMADALDACCPSDTECCPSEGEPT